MRRIGPMLALALLVAAPSARTADQTILGDTLQVRNPSTPNKRKLVGKAKEKASTNTIVGDPTVGGATLTVRANGATPSEQTFTLPPGTSTITGQPFWSGNSVKGYKYKDPKGENGPIKTAQIKKSGSGVFRIKAVGTGKIAAISVLPPNPGTDGCLLLEIDGGDSYSARFGPLDGRITNKAALEYKHKKPASEGTCVVTTTTSSTPTTSSSSSTTSVSTTSSTSSTTSSSTSSSTSSTTSTSSSTSTSSTTSTSTSSTTSTTIPGCSPNCSAGQSCLTNSNCITNACVGGICRCQNQLYTFTVNSNNGGSVDSAEWPGGTAAQSAVSGCSVTINRPDNNVDLVCTAAAPFSINSFSGYSNCFGTGGEDGDGCQPVSCPPAGIGSCCNTRPSCSAALNGSASAQYFVQCLQ